MGRYRYLAGLVLLLAVTAAADLTTWDNGDSGATIRAALQANDAEFSAFKNAIDTDDDESIADEDVVVGSLTAAGADGERRIELKNNTTPITPGAGKVGITNSAGTLQYYNDDGVLHDVGSGECNLVPTKTSSDPDISDTTGWYTQTTTNHLHYVEYGVSARDYTDGALDDSDTTDPVFVASDDSTHDGETPVTAGGVLTELYPTSPAVTFTAVNATPTSGSCTGTYPNYVTPSLTPDGTSTITVTFAADDLAGNSATGTDLVQEFTYSGGAAYLTYWDMTTTSLTIPSGATATLNGATVDSSGLYVEGTDYPSIPFVDGVGVVGTASTIEFEYTQVGTPHSSGRFFEDDTSGGRLNLQRGGSDTAMVAIISGLTDTTSFSSLTANVFDGSPHTIKFEWNVYGGIDGEYFAKLTLDGTEVHYSSSDWPNAIGLSGGNLYIGNRGTGDRPLNGTFKNFKCY